MHPHTHTPPPRFSIGLTVTPVCFSHQTIDEMEASVQQKTSLMRVNSQLRDKIKVIQELRVFACLFVHPDACV